MPDDVVVVSEEEFIVVGNPLETIIVADGPGPQGPPGPTGPAGSTTTYTHTQGVAAAVWTITHNLGRYPAVSVVDSTNREVIGRVVYTSANVITLTFSGAFAGFAFLN